MADATEIAPEGEQPAARGMLGETRDSISAVFRNRNMRRIQLALRSKNARQSCERMGTHPSLAERSGDVPSALSNIASVAASRFAPFSPGASRPSPRGSAGIAPAIHLSPRTRCASRSPFVQVRDRERSYV